MASEVAHKAWWQIFEVVFGVPLLVAIALQVAMPLSIPFGALAPIAVAGGGVLVIAGVALVILARRQLARHGQPIDPGRPTDQLVTTGVFSISRNPLYLGGICAWVGIALALDLPWMLLLLLPALVGCHAILVAPEERYLAAKFGEAYRAYTAAVHRWLGRARRAN